MLIVRSRRWNAINQQVGVKDEPEFICCDVWEETVGKDGRTRELMFPSGPACESYQLGVYTAHANVLTACGAVPQVGSGRCRLTSVPLAGSAPVTVRDNSPAPEQERGGFSYLFDSITDGAPSPSRREAAAAAGSRWCGAVSSLSVGFRGGGLGVCSQSPAGSGNAAPSWMEDLVAWMLNL